VGVCPMQQCAQPAPGTCTGTIRGVCIIDPSCQ
jgi:hypothetical protein